MPPVRTHLVHLCADVRRDLRVRCVTEVRNIYSEYLFVKQRMDILYTNYFKDNLNSKRHLNNTKMT